jgi:hypothetical protein
MVGSREMVYDRTRNELRIISGEMTMLDLDRDSDQAPPGVGQITYLLWQLKRAGDPITLSINGKGNLRIEDDASYQKLLEIVDWLERVEMLRERLTEPEGGENWFTLDELKEQVQNKYGISV